MNSVPHEDNATVLPPSSDAAASSVAPPAGPKRMKAAISGWLRDMLISLAVSAFFIIFLYQPVKVDERGFQLLNSGERRRFWNLAVGCHCDNRPALVTLVLAFGDEAARDERADEVR